MNAPSSDFPIVASAVADRTLSRDEARAVYDRIGAWQDTQAFYEAPALNALVAHGGFEEAQDVFEVGCGTGRFAKCLLRRHCPPTARYEGVDISATMVQLARDRLAPFGDRAAVTQTDGALTFDRSADSQDRFVATYLLDLLSQDDARTLLAEAHRLLQRDGRLCLAGLTWGRGVLSGVVTRLWAGLYSLRPAWVGGCRPLRVQSFLEEERWRILYHTVVEAWGVPSEVLIAAPT